MSKQEDLFHSEHIDEEIEACSHEHSAGRLSPSTHLISDLQRIETENREILAQVWTRLAERGAEKYQSGVEQAMTQSQPAPALRENQRKGPHTMKLVSTEKPVQKNTRHFLEMLVAVLIVAALVSSMAVVLRTKQSVPPHLGSAPQTTPSAQSDASGLYLSTKSGVDKVSLQTGKVLWHIPLDWAGPPFVQGNSVFFTHVISNDSFLEAVNAASGKQLWRKKYGSSNFLLQENGILYDSTCLDGPNGQPSGCFIYAIRPANGVLLWSFATSQGTAWITIQNTIVYGVSSSHLFALNATTGTPLWQKTVSLPDQDINLTPLLLNNVLYTASCNTNKGTSEYMRCYFLAFNSANGAEIWHTPAKTTDGYVADPVGSGGVIYYTDGSLVDAVDARTGSVLWTYTACTGDCSIGSMVATQRTLYIHIDTSSSYIFALNIANRSVLWSKNVDPSYAYGEIWSFHQGLIYMITDRYHVKALDTSSGTVVKSYGDGSETITGFTLISQAG